MRNKMGSMAEELGRIEARLRLSMSRAAA